MSTLPEPLVNLEKRESTASILSIGTGVPLFQVDCRTSAKFAAQTSCVDEEHARKVNVLYRRTGIETRGSVLLEETPGEDATHEFYPPAVTADDRGPSTKRRNDRFGAAAPDLAHRAAAAALESSGLAADEITHLITVTCTGFNAPGIDIALIDRLGLPKTTERIQVGFMGCHAAINGMRAARGLVASNPNAKVLLCCVELCSLHFQYGDDTDLIVSNALFADGAGAMVISHGSGAGDAIDTPIQSETPFGNVVATGSCLVPGSRDAMTWRIGDHGYLMTLSAQVPGLIEQHLESFLTDWLAAQGETIESVGGWAVHPGGSRILSSVESALKLDAEDLRISRGVLANHGNMSSATMLFILKKFAEAAIPKPWLMLGFGPGLEIEVALIR
jgi:predicted naringenin-chalcone synthase